MKTGFNLGKGILLFSALLLLSLLWLSVSFLITAKNELRSAVHQERYVEADNSLRDAIVALAEESAGIYWLTGLDGLFFVQTSIEFYTRESDRKLALSLDKLRETLLLSKYSEQLSLSSNRIQVLLGALDTKLERLDDHRNSLVEDLKLPLAKRDYDLHASTIDYYAEIIQHLGLIRDGSRYFPEKHNREAENEIQLSNLVWNNLLLSKSISAFIERYLTTDDRTQIDFGKRSDFVKKQLDRNMDALDRFNSHGHLQSPLDTELASLVEWQKGTYAGAVNEIKYSIDQDGAAPYSNWDWKKIANQLHTRHQGILTQIDSLSMQRINSDKKRASRNLVIDIVLVIACFLLSFCAFWIVRLVHHNSTHDELTDIPSRHLFKTLCEKRIKSGQNKHTDYSLYSLQLQKFDYVYNHFGQAIGDLALQKLVVRIRGVVGDQAILGHIGVDDFSIFIPVEGDASATEIATELSHAIANKLEIDGYRLSVDSCIGHACCRSSDYEELRKASQLALYDAQQKGPGTISSYDDAMAEAFLERQRMELDIEQAMERKELELFYQPQFDLQDERVSGVEALIRWNHPTLGRVSPDKFIPIAENSGLLPAIGEWVIDESCRQSAYWNGHYGLNLRMSINVSIHQFHVGDIVRKISNAIDENRLSPDSLEIEITETVAMDELDLVLSKLNAVRELGVRVALDDFGTGYSSLSYLQSLPLDTLKIDKSFVNNDMERNPTSKILFESIAQIADRLQFHTVAEGVETHDQLLEVRQLGIHTVQGYYYSRPIEGGSIPEEVSDINTRFGSSAAKAA